MATFKQFSSASGPPDVVQRTLSESNRRFRLFVERVKDYAIFMLDSEGRVVTWNKGAERIKGYRAEEIIGQHISRFYTPEDVEAGLPAHLLKTAESEGRVEKEGWRVRKDGSRFWADVSITAVRDEEGRLEGFGKVTRDLTERKKAEQALSELSGRLLEAQDKERKRISIALSDSTSPSFVALVSKLYLTRKRTEGFTSQLVDESIALAESLFREIRTVSYLLHPLSLEEDGLLPTLRSYLDRLSKERGISLDIEFPLQLERLSQTAEVTLYRVVQECLPSILHASGNSRATVRLRVDQGCLRLEVEDQGRRLSSAALEEVKKGIGELGIAIAGIRERMKLLGGRLEVNSMNSGTSVIADLPIGEETIASSGEAKQNHCTT